MMDATEFLSRVLPQLPGAYYSAHWLDHTKTRGQGFFGQATQSLDELDKLARWASRKSMCAYFACAAQMRAEVKSAVSGQTRFRPIRNAANAKAAKSLWMDIDVGKANGYAELKLAVNAVTTFCLEAAVPTPTIVVSSGSGLHLYWTMTQPISPSDWHVLAQALKAAAANHGLLQDPTRTADIASVLRVPGTTNWKDPANPRSVVVLGTKAHDYTPEELRDALAPYATLARPASAQLPSGFGDLTANMNAEARPVDLASVLPECEVLRVAAETGGADFEEPLWYQTLRAASYAIDGREWAHKMSSGHPGYDAAETEKKYMQAQAAREANDLGWPRCSSFHQRRPDMCARCPRFSEGRSPLNFRRGEAAGVSSDLPEPYYRHEQTQLIFLPAVAKKEDDEELPTPLCVIDYPLRDAELVMQEGKQALRFTATVRTTKKSFAITVPLEKLADNRSTLAILSGYGLMVTHQFQERIRQFLMAWTKKLQRATEATTNPAFGWVRDGDNLRGFAYGGACHTDKEPLPVVEADQKLRVGYSPTGTFEAWRDAAHALTASGRPQIDAILATAFAAPLVEFTDEMGMVMSFVSPGSGTGKTSGMRTAQAVWGDPHTEMNALNDTPASVAHKIGSLRSLPLYWDELRGDEDTLKFSTLVFNVTQGKDRSRMTASIERRAVGSWNTMMIVAGNQSILERMADASPEGPAGLYRVFEVTVPAIPEGSRSFVEFGTLVGRVRTNYGQVGLKYAEYLGKNIQATHARVKQIAAFLNERCGAKHEERYWIYTMATVLVGAELSVKLGFTSINCSELAKFLINVALPQMRDALSETGAGSTEQSQEASAVLAGFLRSLQPDRYLVTDTAPRPGAVNVVTVLSNARLLRRPEAHMIRDRNELRVSRRSLNDYLRERKLYRRGFANDMLDKLGARSTCVQLGVGTEFESATKENCWTLDLANPALASLRVDV